MKHNKNSKEAVHSHKKVITASISENTYKSKFIDIIPQYFELQKRW